MAVANSILESASIVGVGESEYGKRLGRTTTDLLIEACTNAFDDAGMDPSDVDGVVLADDRISFKPDKFELAFGLKQLRFSAAYSMFGGAGMSWAVVMACLAIANGMARNVVVYMGRASVSEAESWNPRKVHAEDPYKALLEVPYGWFPQPVYFGTFARRHMEEYGTEEKHLGMLASAARVHASKNRNAVIRDPMSLEQYFESTVVAEPLRRPDCCLINDGAAAVVLTARESERDFKKTPVRVIGASQAYPPKLTYWAQQPDFTSTTGPLTRDAFSSAGVSPQEMDFVTIYDCFTIAVLMQLEDLGFCGKGEGGPYIEQEGVDINSKIPVNPHGGLLAQSYVSGMNHIVEAVRQLRGEADLQVRGAELGAYSGFSDTAHGTLVMAKG